jgi:hypothetical protein
LSPYTPLKKKGEVKREAFWIPASKEAGSGSGSLIKSKKQAYYPFWDNGERLLCLLFFSNLRTRPNLYSNNEIVKLDLI